MQEIGVSINVPIDEYQQRLQAASSDNSHLAIIVHIAVEELFQISYLES